MEANELIARGLAELLKGKGFKCNLDKNHRDDGINIRMVSPNGHHHCRLLKGRYVYCGDSTTYLMVDLVRPDSTDIIVEAIAYCDSSGSITDKCERCPKYKYIPLHQYYLSRRARREERGEKK